MVVVVDKRETRSGIVDELERCDVEVELETLNTGDYLVDGYIIERKAYGDFVSSMMSSESNLIMQLNAMQAAAEKNDLIPVLVVEGDLKEGLSYTKVSAKQPTIMLSSIFKKGDIRIMHTAGVRATAQFLAKLESEETAASPSSIRDTPSVPDELMPIYLTEGFQGIGPSTARKLLNHFDTFYNIVNASKDELQEVPGIGSSRAEDIYEVTRRELPDDE